MYSPASVSESNRHGAEEQIALGFTDNGIISGWRNDYKLAQAVPGKDAEY